MEKKIFVSAAMLGLIAVILGAFASHGLRANLSVTALESFQTGVRYQMYHAFFSFCDWTNATTTIPTKKAFVLAYPFRDSFVFGLYLFVGHQCTNSH